jgi:hypothetical protein
MPDLQVDQGYDVLQIPYYTLYIHNIHNLYKSSNILIRHALSVRRSVQYRLMIRTNEIYLNFNYIHLFCAFDMQVSRC